MGNYNSTDVGGVWHWGDRAIRRIIRDEFKRMGLPTFILHGTVDSVYKNGTQTFANCYLNFGTTISPNIPVNPDIADKLTPNTHVWVMAPNFDQRHLYVLARQAQ